MSAFQNARTKWICIAGSILLASAGAWTLHAAFQQPKPAESPVSLNNIAWMAGTWRAVDGEETTDETWLPPYANSMVGTCRIATADRVVVYEFMLIEQDKDGGVNMSMRHYRWNMEDRDKSPIRWKLTQADERVALFEDPGSERFVKLQYDRIDANKLRVTLTPKPDPRAKMRQMIFELNRVDHNKGG